MKPHGIRLRSLLNGKIVSILTAIFVVATMFAVSVSNDEPARDAVFDDIIAEDPITEIDPDVIEDVDPEMIFETDPGLPPDAIKDYLDPVPQSGGMGPLVLDDTMYAYNTWDSSGAFTRGPMYHPLNDPGTITTLAATSSSEFQSGGTWTNDGKWLTVQYGSGNGDLWEINPDTGAMTSIGGGGTSMNGLAYDPVSGKLYGAASYDLYEINIATGAQTSIGSYGGGALMIGIAFDQYGVLYGWDIGQDKLWTIDTSSGAATEVGPLKVGGVSINLNYAQDGAFDHKDDTLYLNAFTLSPNWGGHFYKCNEDTAVCELVGQHDGNSEVTASAIPYTLAPGGTTTIQLGSDNPERSGQGMGYSYRSGTRYYCYASYYAYNYDRTSGSYERRGWAAFDLADLKQWSGATVKNAKLLIHNEYRYRAKDFGFTALTTTPREGGPASTCKNIHDESGPTGTQIGQYTATSTSDSSKHTITVNLNAAAVTAINNVLSGSPTYYTFGIGIDVQTLHPGSTYGYSRWKDIRLVVTFDHGGDLKQTQSGQGIALGDDWSGYLYKYRTNPAYNYPYGHMYIRKYSSGEYRAYAQWEMSKIAGVLPSGAITTIKKVSLRFNHQYSSQGSLYVYGLTNDVKTASGDSLFTDCADGAPYYGPGSVTFSDSEYTWDLGAGGVTDLQDALDLKRRTFAVCMITTSTSGYSYNYGPRLVIEWDSSPIIVEPAVADAGPDQAVDEGEEVILDGSGSSGTLVSFEWDYESDGTYDYIESVTPTGEKTIQLGADNPERAGQATGYSYRSSSGTYYQSYASYYAYPYDRTTGTYERRGWTTFDLADLNAWSGVTVKEAKLLVHNYRRYYARELVFNALTTTPYEYPGSTISKAVFDESGPGGTEIGSYYASAGTDYSYHTIEVPLNSAAVTAINGVLSGSPTYYTWAIGIYVKTIYPGRSYGYAQWTDIRLSVTFEYTDELAELPSGQGVAFGDDWSGYLYKYRTNPTRNYAYGYMYVRRYSYYEYRSYAQWEVQKIADVLPSGAEIKAVGLRFNHVYSSQGSLYVYNMENNAKTASGDTLFADCADGSAYTGPESVTSSDSEYTWNLGADGVTDLKDAIDNNLETFGVCMLSTSTSGYSYNHGARLVIEWKSPGGGALSGLARHTYGDNGVYTVTLRVTDAAGQTDTDTCTVTVANVNPVITPIGPFTVNEGSPLSISATVTDEGSDDLQYEWSFELGPTYVNMHYNDGVGPDPFPSPDGTFPFTVTDSVVHTYGDNAVYNLGLTVTDDDGGAAAFSTTITVVNVAPSITPFGPLSVNEGSPISMTAVATDRGSDDLTYEWELELGPSSSATYYNDGMGPDPPKSPWGTFPFSATDTHGHTYGDNGVYAVKLTVTDDDGASTVYTTTITVNNVAPSVSVEAYIHVDFTLRVSGEKWHNVELYVNSGGSMVAYADVLRMPGDPDDQSITLLGVRCDVTRNIGLRVMYTPFDDVINGQINGADPAWVTIRFESGDEYVFDNTFNYMQPQRWDWRFNINQYLIGQPITFEGHATDPGSDDLRFLWEWGDGFAEGASYFNNGVSPDPAKSPDGVFPFSVDELRIHTYWTNNNFPMVLTVSDDDGGVTVLVVIIVII